MSEQILSQDEIDALLSAMDEGEVDISVNDEKNNAEAIIEKYDLTAQSMILRDQFYALERVYDKFTNLLHSSLATSLQKGVNVEYVSTEMVKFGEFLDAFDNPTSFAIFSMEPLIGASLMAIEPNLVFSFIDCLFGGNGKPLKEVREFTLIEERMMKKIALDALKCLEEAWGTVYPVNISLKKTESKCEFVHLLPPNDLTVALVFSIKGEVFSGNIHLCIPYLLLEPIKDKLSSRFLREIDSENLWDTQLKMLLKETKTKVVSHLGKNTNYTFRNLLNLQAGDIINLDNGPEDLVSLTIEEMPKYEGRPGVLKGSKAIKITKIVRTKDGGASRDGQF